MNDQPLEARIGGRLKARKLTFAAAESCTGGLILHRMTNIAGSSAYVLGGAVVYAYEAKVKLVAVKWETLQQFGAVSEQTALEMARGARAAFGSDIALSVTGIAGPGGGTDTKPVGLTYIGLVAPGVEQVQRFVWNGDREQNKASSAEAALHMLYAYLIGSQDNTG
jgi:PncC family amidohydrolase